MEMKNTTQATHSTNSDLNPVVSSYTEWDPLEEVIVGRIENSNFAPNHVSVKAVAPSDVTKKLPYLGSKPIPQELIDLAKQELDQFITILKGEGVVVKRPEVYDHTKVFQTPYWRCVGLTSACPRDGFLIIGNEIIETPMAWRSRYFEGFSYRKLFRHYFDQGAKWTAAPKPELLDSLYKQNFIPPSTTDPIDYVINNSEVVFDAADFIRCGKDIIGHESNVTNLAGIEWLRRHLGDRYRIHIINTSNWRHPMHIDASFVPLKPGVALINPDDIDINKLPNFIKEWDLIIAPRPNTTTKTKYSKFNMCSDWLSVNILSLDENRIIVEKQQTDLISCLKKHGFKVITCPFEHYSPFGGSFHCATLDIRRQGKLESYFDLENI